MADVTKIQAPDGTSYIIMDKSLKDLNDFLEELLDGSEEEDVNAGA